MQNSTELGLPPGLAETEISIFANARATDPQPVKLGVVLAAIQTGRWADQMAVLRELLASGDKDSYDDQKKTLPAVTLSGSFEKRNAGGLIQHSGLLQIDLDHLGKPAEVRDQLAADPHVAAALLSPSAQGVKGVMLMPPGDAERHKHAFKAAVNYLQETYGLENDRACKDVCRMMFVSHDPELRTNPDAVVLDVKRWTPEEPQPSFVSSEERPPSEENERVRDALTHLSSEAYADWIRICAALKNSNLPGAFELWHEWSAKTSTYQGSEDCQGTWDALKANSGIDHTAIYRAATEAGWNAPKRKLQTGRPESWSEPVPLIGEENDQEPYPVDCLGRITTEAVREFREYGQQPLAMIGSSALATISLCCQGLADIARDTQNSSPISLSILCIAESGERKTTVDRTFSKSLKEWQRDRNRELEPEILESNADHAAWKSEKEGYIAAIREVRKKKSGTDNEVSQLKQQLRDKEKNEPEITRPVRLFFEEATPEGLAWFAGIGHPSFSLWSDEGGLTIGGRGMSEDSLLAFLALLNRLWDGGSFEPTRKTAKTSAVVGRRNTVNLMMQFAVLERLCDAQDGVSRSLGTLARCLIVHPQSTQGTRAYKVPPGSTPKLDAFHRRVNQMMEHPLPLNERRELEPPALQFSPGAKTKWVEFFNTVENGLADEGEFAGIRDFASKAGEQAARLAGLLHVFEKGPSGEVSEGMMVRAVALEAWYLEEARRIFSGGVIPPQIREAKMLCEWLVKRCREGRSSKVSKPDILQFGPNRVRQREQRDRALGILEDHGAVRQVNDGQKKLIELNPALLQ